MPLFGSWGLPPTHGCNLTSGEAIQPGLGVAGGVMAELGRGSMGGLQPGFDSAGVGSMLLVLEAKERAGGRGSPVGYL